MKRVIRVIKLLLFVSSLITVLWSSVLVPILFGKFFVCTVKFLVFFFQLVLSKHVVISTVDSKAGVVWVHLFLCVTLLFYH